MPRLRTSSGRVGAPMPRLQLRLLAGHVAQLKRYDDAFAKFFARLAAHGITKENTLFVITVAKRRPASARPAI
jgi:hypothetical protein